jgi:hypothetical protein
MNPSCRARRFIVAFALLGSALASVAESEPQVLPKVTVSAGVPLVKVAEYQMLEPRYAPAAVARGDFIYIVGGLNAIGTASNSVERLDVHTGRTEIVAHLRVARQWHRAVMVGEKIYVLGGATPGSVSGSLDYFRVLESAVSAGHRTNSIVLPPSVADGGGVDLEASVEIVDLATGKVSRGPTMLEPREQFACVETDGQIYVLGGGRIYRGKFSFTNTTEILDVAKNQWRQGVPMPRPRSTDGAIVDGGFIVVAGGYDGFISSDAVYSFELRTGTWRTNTPLCRSTSAHSVAFLGNYLYLFGDYTAPELLLAYNLKTKESETFTLGYSAARHTAAVVADGRIFIIGGTAGKNLPMLRTIQVFAPAKTAERKL